MSVDLLDIGLMAALLFIFIFLQRVSRKLDRVMSAMKETMPLIESFSKDVDRAQVTVAEFRESAREAPNPDKRTTTPARRSRGMSLIEQFYAVAGKKEKA